MHYQCTSPLRVLLVQVSGLASSGGSNGTSAGSEQHPWSFTDEQCQASLPPQGNSSSHRNNSRGKAAASAAN